VARAARRVRPLTAAASASMVTEMLVQVVVLRVKKERSSHGVESETQMSRSKASTWQLQ